MKFYSNTESLVNVANSILNHYDLAVFHDTYKPLDTVLKRNQKKKLVLMLLDGLGSAIQEKYANSAKTLLQSKFSEITSVFPPTTAAATTALLTGLYPIETGWLGWTGQFKEQDEPIVMFSSHGYFDETIEARVNTYDKCPLTTIIDMLKEKNILANSVQSFNFPDFESYFQKTEDSIMTNQFTYSYCTEPDSSLHMYSTDSSAVDKIIAYLDSKVLYLTEKYPDVLFIVLADHGHKNVKNIYLSAFPDLLETLRLNHYAIEARAASFFVKEGRENEFKKLAKKYLSEHFYIYDKDEVRKLNIFGNGIEAVSFSEEIGDFLLVSKDESVLIQPEGNEYFLSTHGGSTAEERRVNLSVFNDK